MDDCNGEPCDKGLAFGTECLLRFGPIRDARCGSFKQAELGHCSPHREGEIRELPPSWRLPPNEGQLCPHSPVVAWVSVLGGQKPEGEVGGCG